MGASSGPGWLDRAGWRTALDQLGPELADVYFGPEYHALHEQNGDGSGVCFAARSGDAQLLVPGLRTPIDDTTADLQTCNGYGGPLASPSADPAFLARAWDEWREAARADHIIAALFRLHPLLDNRRWLPADAVVRLERQTVFVDTARGADHALQTADARHRNMVNKARRDGARVTWLPRDGWQPFVALYHEAMARLHAPPSLDFGDAYFAALREHPAAELAIVGDASAPLAGAVFLWGACFGHYHLAARRLDAPNYAASFLLHAAVERAAAAGLAGLHLGGGTTNAPDDPLLRFKRSLGGRACEFEVALVIADEAAYRALVAERAARGGKPATWLLAYRQPA